MAFFNPQQQQQLMAQMFQNPGGGGMPPMPGGQGGAGAGMGLGPSFQGPEGVPGVQSLPFSGNAPDFSMEPFSPTAGPNFQDLGSSQGMGVPQLQSAGYEPDGFFQGAAAGFNPTQQQKTGPGMRPPRGSAPNSPPQPSRDAAPGFDPRSDDDRKRQVLIDAIMRKAMGG